MKQLLLLVILIGICCALPCDYYKPYISKTPTCTAGNSDYYLAPNPSRTPYGGIDVSSHGCPYIYSNQCCQITPRWNWVLGGCDPGMPPVGPSSPFACKAGFHNSSRYDFYYISAYQWDGSSWNLDHTSSVFGHGGLINTSPLFEKLKIDGTGSPHPAGGDWQAKWTPRSATTGTQGLGPPGFMFVLSAKSVQWMTFYALTQLTLNRGPEGQFAPGYNNCWYAELDFLESPFWSSSRGQMQCYLNNHPHASFFSTGAQYGGCFPMGETMGNQFSSECYTDWCCEATACATGFKPFMNPDQYGSSIAGCSQASNPPPGTTWLGPKNDPQKCPNFKALGGCGSSSFFDNDPNTEYIFAFVIDGRGIYGYRWVANSQNQASAIWPGIEKFTSQAKLANRPGVRPTKTSTPCLPTDEYCVIFHPTSQGQRPCVSAAGDVQELDHMGVAAAAGHNWWDLFEDSGQWWNYDSTVLPVTFTN